MKIIVSLLFLCLSIICHAHVELPKLFSDGMVLQRNKPIPVWGWAKPNEKITVSFKNQKLKTKADKTGKWKVVLKAEKAGGPFSMNVQGKNNIVLDDVLIGEVWICSGQSNMEWPVSQSDNFEAERNDSDYPNIRHFLLEKDMAGKPKEKLKEGNWEVCSNNTVGQFTAVGYFFAKQLYEKLEIPVGIINTSWGGTCVETWTSKQAFENNDEFKSMIAEMPNIDIDSLQSIQINQIAKRIERMQGDKIDVSNENYFMDLGFNDSKWPEMYAPKLWENQELGELDGTVWMRKSFMVLKEDAGKKAVLELAKIDDQDTTYVNGVAVGTTKRYDEKRVYQIDENILKEGKNTIAIKIFDYAGGGGIWGNAVDLQLSIGDTVIPLAGDWKFQVVDFKSSLSPNSYPSLLYNAMVNPLIPYAFQGVIWYQGEANVNRAEQYKKAFPLMIKYWRNQWNQGDFPFYFVQLSTFDEFGGNSNKGSKWAELREAQSYTLQTVKNAGMAVTIDIGNPKDIHPTNKQDVGSRLAAIALNKVYKKDNVYSGPTYESMAIQNNKVVLTFDSIGSGLTTPNKYGYLKGFEVAGEDKVFHYVKAVIKGDKVIISCKAVKTPKAVRYGWADDAGDCNLYNNEGFPASPFRTDRWDKLTSGEIYKF
ncbi:sialate O-acetylesterase [Flavisericum labens]|uniref:sialate O-acetylesterase n=1 Tax=Flavisericum labens TaxID=3377112 RepID=UPI00387B1EAF